MDDTLLAGEDARTGMLPPKWCPNGADWSRFPASRLMPCRNRGLFGTPKIDAAAGVATLARFPARPHNTCMSETLLDVKGMSCPLPVLRANRLLRSLAPGERLRVLATDRAAIADFKAFCQETGHALIAMSEEAGVLSFIIRRRPDPDPGSPTPGQRDTKKVPSTTKET
jgi:tRNA 2-thiouridine synthesizing protein A